MIINLKSKQYLKAWKKSEKGKESTKKYNVKTNYSAQKKWSKTELGRAYQKKKNAKNASYRLNWIKEKYKNDPEFKKRILLNSKKFRNSEKGISYHKNFALRKSFGISLTEYNEMVRIQKGLCACCGRSEKEMKKKLTVDHCHITGKIRGLLCFKCNSGIGMLGDSYESVSAALIYLVKTSSFIKNSNSG